MVKGNTTADGAPVNGAHVAGSGTRGRSIRDVAQAAGVSITTVSHALHGTRHVAAGTRVRIESAASRLGYQPNRLARGLRTRRTHTVGMLISHLRNPLVASYVEGAEAVLGAAGYGLVLASTHLQAELETRGLALCQQMGADGLIVAAPSAGLLAQLTSVAVDRPIALINALPPPRMAASGIETGEGHSIMAAVVDERRAGCDATAHLVEQGHRRIAFLGRGTTLWNVRERLAGYRDALERANIAFDHELVFDHEPPEASATPVLSRLLATPDTPTAAYVAHNLVALRLIEALQDAGVDVPDGIALVVSADEDWMRVVRPRLTAIEIPARELGASAARLLLSALERGEIPSDTAQSNGSTSEGRQTPHVHVLRAPLAVRDSSAGRQTRRSG